MVGQENGNSGRLGGIAHRIHVRKNHMVRVGQLDKPFVA
jgi:hypothetical protein